METVHSPCPDSRSEAVIPKGHGVALVALGSTLVPRSAQASPCTATLSVFSSRVGGESLPASVASGGLLQLVSPLWKSLFP